VHRIFGILVIKQVQKFSHVQLSVFYSKKMFKNVCKQTKYDENILNKA